ncbi:MAG: hypothetical protein JXA91_04525 [Candidatus Thermoplasmatota archaeon]|nr:hypothetical protein [Candidatus Thermoplasmatota archaeon]
MVWVEVFWKVLTIVGIGALLNFWNNFADWMSRSVLPWFEENLPQLKPLVKEVFLKIDSIVTPIIQKLRRNWEELKSWFIGQLVYYERKSPNSYLQRVCSYFRKSIDKKLNDKEEIIEQKSEKTINPIDIPVEFRDKILGNTHSKINTTDFTDKAIEKMGDEMAATI